MDERQLLHKTSLSPFLTLGPQPPNYASSSPSISCGEGSEEGSQRAPVASRVVHTTRASLLMLSLPSAQHSPHHTRREYFHLLTRASIYPTRLLLQPRPWLLSYNHKPGLDGRCGHYIPAGSRPASIGFNPTPLRLAPCQGQHMLAENFCMHQNCLLTSERRKRG